MCVAGTLAIVMIVCWIEVQFILARSSLYLLALWFVQLPVRLHRAQCYDEDATMISGVLVARRETLGIITF